MPGKSNGPRSLVGYNPWGHKESDTTEQFLCAEAQISNGLLQGQGLWLQQTWEVQYVSPTTKPLSKQPTNGRTIIPKKFLHCCESSKAHNTFPNLGIQAKDWESKVAQSCPTLCYPVYCSPPGSSVHGIFQARIMEWVAISFSR